MASLETQLIAHIRDVPDFPKPGILFKDISPIFLNPELVASCTEELAKPWQDQGITKVIGVESRGFLLGLMLAQQLGAGFVLARKAGKLPPKTISHSYKLEYGEATIEIKDYAISSADKVLVHDDLLATGGTASAAAALVQELSGHVAGFCFLMELGFLAGREKINKISPQVHALLKI